MSYVSKRINYFKQKQGHLTILTKEVHIISILVYKRKPESLSYFPNKRENKLK